MNDPIRMRHKGRQIATWVTRVTIKLQLSTILLSKCSFTIKQFSYQNAVCIIKEHECFLCSVILGWHWRDCLGMLINDSTLCMGIISANEKQFSNKCKCCIR